MLFYEDKPNRLFRVVRKNLHNESIKIMKVQDLRKNGYKMLLAINKLKWGTLGLLNVRIYT